MIDAPFGRFGSIDKPRIPRLFRTRTGESQIVDEHIGSAAVVRDKAKALLAVEPFGDSLCYVSRFLIVPTLPEPQAGKRSLQVPTCVPGSCPSRAGNRKGLQLRPFTPWWRPACWLPPRSRCARRCAETPSAS